MDESQLSKIVCFMSRLDVLLNVVKLENMNVANNPVKVTVDIQTPTATTKLCSFLTL